MEIGRINVDRQSGEGDERWATEMNSTKSGMSQRFATRPRARSQFAKVETINGVLKLTYFIRRRNKNMRAGLIADSMLHTILNLLKSISSVTRTRNVGSSRDSYW